MRLQILYSALGFLSLCLCLAVFADPSSEVILGDFAKGWDRAWERKLLSERGNRFRVVEEDGNKVLKIHSSGSASGMYREIKLKPMVPGTLSWFWKVKSSIEKNTKEREKTGDDYAARVFVLYEPNLFSWRIPTVCYVWAGNEKTGSIFKSPYSNQVCTIVLQSGNEKAEKWVLEKRNYFEDYVKCFGRNPKELSAVAIMSDTDNTGAQTTAWFDRMIINTNTSLP